jgi:protein translocase SecG subunit
MFLLGLCAFTILLILMQRPSEETGLGATLGGSAAAAVLGGEAVNVLAKITKYCVIAFFVLAFVLSMLHLALEETNKPKNLLQKRVVVEVTTATNETPTIEETNVADSSDANVTKNEPAENVKDVEKFLSDEELVENS